MNAREKEIAEMMSPLLDNMSKESFERALKETRIKSKNPELAEAITEKYRKKEPYNELRELLKNEQEKTNNAFDKINRYI